MILSGLRRAVLRLDTGIRVLAGPHRRLATAARAHGPVSAALTSEAMRRRAGVGFQVTGQLRFFSDSKVHVKTPELGGESITEGSIGTWNVKIGDEVKKGDVIAVIETDKVTVDVKSHADGQVMQILVQVDEKCQVGQALCELGPLGSATPICDTKASPVAVDVVLSSSAVSAVPAYRAAAPSATAPKPAAAPSCTAVTAQSGVPQLASRLERREKMKRMRLAIARNLKDSQNTLAMLTTFQEVDMSGLIKMRKDFKERFEMSHGAKLGFQSPFFMASAYALKQIPAINAYIDNATNEIVYRDYINIGFAAATPKGLVTPVIRNMESKSIREVEDSFAALAGLAKQDKLGIDDITGHTFTITNGGVFGSMLGTPLIGSTTTAAALGLHATNDRPVVLKDGEIGVRPIMYIALTYDHRLVDGREAVTFLCMVRDQVEDPRRMLLGV